MKKKRFSGRFGFFSGLRRVLRYLPRPTLFVLLLIPCLFGLDWLCYQIALPMSVNLQQGKGTLLVGKTSLSLGTTGRMLAIKFPFHNPLIHEYQIDGTDSTNNLDLDTNYLSQISHSFYYRLQAWMRDLDGTSRWRNLTIERNGQVQTYVAWPTNGGTVLLPATTTLQLHLQLQRPETPMSFELLLSNQQTLQVTLDRNNRTLTVTNLTTDTVVASTFFPLTVAPFAAMIADTLVRILLWASCLLLGVQLLEILVGLIRAIWGRYRERPDAPGEKLLEDAADAMFARDKHRNERGLSLAELEGDLLEEIAGATYTHTRTVLLTSDSQMQAAVSPAPAPKTNVRTRRPWPLVQAIHPLALIGLGCSLLFVIWIAVKEYQGEPHIYDASAYLFAAKMYATGQLSVPAPALPKLFPGAFMVIAGGRWFAQYDPGTSLTLVPGLWLGMPWIVEPLLGTLALLGIGLIAARLYNRRVATLAVLLGCLSPFYSYLAASYLSHTVALFYLVWGLWGLLRFVQGGRGWSLPLSACCFGMAFLTRDLVALLYIALFIPGTLLMAWERGKHRRSPLAVMAWILLAVIIAMSFGELYMGFNQILTGNPLITPRDLFFAGDHWGFGTGIGFYGQHTLAAGLVNLDELLTILQIDLFGWPFYLTLALLALPFLLGKARKTDWILLAMLVLTVGSYIGYFYHGIYLGPRYLYEDLIFLLILSARGILLLGSWGMNCGHAALTWLKRTRSWTYWTPRPIVSAMTVGLICLLVLCNLIYYLPRQVSRFQNYNGLPNLEPLNVSEIYHAPLHNALVITDDLAIYQLVLFPLNDPALKGPIVYAWISDYNQIAQLQKQFPGRSLYLLVINADGSVSYFLLQ
jgi:hypothetical protein